MLCRQIMGNMFWSLVPVLNTFKAMLWLLTMAFGYYKKKRAKN
jgi:hypothetical protein